MPVVLAVLLLMSCHRESLPKPADVTVRFETVVQGDPVVLNQIKYPTQAGHRFSLLNLKYYLTHISLVADDDSRVELAKVHLADIHDTTSLSLTAFSVPSGHYKGLEFTFGIPKMQNLVDFLDNTLANQNMLWPAQLGPGAYHYMKCEGQFDSLDTGVILGYAFHLGPSMGGDYSFDVRRDIDLTIDGQARELSIVMDVYNWFHDPNTYDFAEWLTGIMNKPTVQAIAKENGYNVFSVTVD